MKQFCTVLVACLFVFGFSYGQEVLGPIGAMKRGEGKPKSLVKTTSTVDSLVVYSFDTLSLPITDEFSRNNFSALNQQAGNPGQTQVYFYLITDQSDVPFSPSTLFSTNITKRRTTQNNVTTDSDLPSQTIKQANFQYYPIQYNTITVYPPYTIYDTLDFPNDPDTVYLSNPNVYQDSISIFYAHESDPSKIWTDRSTYHNYTHAKDPWTLGVVTFDGLDENGFPYVFGSQVSGIADMLTSKCIDLSSQLPSDSIYLSFLVQPGGLGDEPEVTDSIYLQFYDVNGDVWNRVWGMKGSASSDFKYGHVRISSAQYLTAGFRFRFVNVGGLSGMLDEFHLDYVKLRAGSGYQDTLFKDYAFSYPVGSLLKEYTQVPWDHWVNQPTHMNDSVKVVVRNNSNISENNMNGTVVVKYAGTTEGSFTLIGQDLSGGNINYAPRTTYDSYHDFTGGYTFSTTPAQTTKTFDVIANAGAPFPNLSLNDSSFTQQVFENVYAYDDGSAEAAYGIIGAQARLAMRFEPYQADTLLGVRMCFVPSVNDMSNKLFLLTVWADNNGKPGNVLYEDAFFFPRTPVYEDGRGVFTDYILNDQRLALDGSPFYVGWRQIDADRLNIGFDRNNPKQDKTFYSTNGGATWFNSTQAGVPMIRPLFSTSDNYTLGNVENREEISWQAFPNPTNGIITLRWNETIEFPGALVVDVQGRKVAELDKNTLSVDLSGNVSGIYFIRLNNSGEVLKIIRQ